MRAPRGAGKEAESRQEFPTSHEVPVIMAFAGAALLLGVRQVTYTLKSNHLAWIRFA